MFQMKGIGFKQIQRKKRTDRGLQVAILGTIASGCFFLAKRSIGLVAKATGRSQIQVSLAFGAVLLAAAKIKTALGKMEPEAA